MRRDSLVAVEDHTAECWERDFARQMALAEPKDTVRGVFCNGVLRFVRKIGCEELVKRCLEVSGEEKFVDFFNYPVATYLRMVSIAMRSLAERHGNIDDALRQFGRQAMLDLNGSVAGKALGLMRTGDMRSTLEGLRVFFRVAVSFGEYELVWTGPTSARLTMRRVFMPYLFHEGLLLTLLDRKDIRAVKVRGRQLATLDSEFEISWE